MLDNNLSLTHVSVRREALCVSILLMLDNNLSQVLQKAPIIPDLVFQSFLCWIIIYHSIKDNDFTATSRVSILLMLDNNLSLGGETLQTNQITEFQSFLCWIIIYHLGIVSAVTRITEFQSFLCWIIIYHGCNK